MAFESKVVRGNEFEAYLHFGWQVADKHRSGTKKHHTSYTLARDLGMKNIDKIKLLEEAYFKYKSRIRTYEPANPMICIPLFILLIFPMVLYLIYKKNEKAEIEENNNYCRKAMYDLVQQAKALLVEK